MTVFLTQQPLLTPASKCQWDKKKFEDYCFDIICDEFSVQYKNWCRYNLIYKKHTCIYTVFFSYCMCLSYFRRKSMFLVSAFLEKSARLIQWLAFFGTDFFRLRRNPAFAGLNPCFSQEHFSCICLSFFCHCETFFRNSFLCL